MADDAQSEDSRRAEAALHRRAGQDQDRIEREARAAGRAVMKDVEREMRAHRHRSQGPRRVDGVAVTSRFTLVRGVGLVSAVVALGVAAILDDPRAWLPWLAAVPATCLALGLFFWFDALTWRRRLPWALEGDRIIEGLATTSAVHGDVIRVTVTVTLRSGEVHPVLTTALILLARQAQALKPEGVRGYWQMVPGTTRAEGDSNFDFFEGRVLERWLRRDLRLVHRITPVERVTVHAEFAGTFQLDTTPDMMS